MFITLGLCACFRFFSLDETPIAAASIAQVHHAVLKDGEEVAIKVGHIKLGSVLKALFQYGADLIN